MGINYPNPPYIPSPPPRCDCKACVACEKMREIHAVIIHEKRHPTPQEFEEMSKLMEDIIDNGKYYL
jgi:hypothetical protein